MIYLGCPQWSNLHWKKRIFTSHCHPKDMLSEYASIFNSVEGNTTFYADPSEETVLKWRDNVPDSFKFTFKVPQRFSHHYGLKHCKDELLDWCKLMSPLFEKTGMLMLQLPKQCGPEHQKSIAEFLSWMPSNLTLGIEVRHLAFFQKGDDEKYFNQLLIQKGINRVAMDTRALFSEPPSTEAIIDAQRKKPHLPVHAIATADAPMIRFVGCSTLSDNRTFYAPWLNKLKTWMSEGKTPFVFFHTADNHDSPMLARQFIQDLGLHHSVCDPFPYEKETKQHDLF